MLFENIWLCFMLEVAKSGRRAKVKLLQYCISTSIQLWGMQAHMHTIHTHIYPWPVIQDQHRLQTKHSSKHKLHQRPDSTPLPVLPGWKKFSTKYISRYITYHPSSNWLKIPSMFSSWPLDHPLTHATNRSLWFSLDSLLTPVAKPHSLWPFG